MGAHPSGKQAGFGDLLAEAAQWREVGTLTIRQELESQVRNDGSHFEQSTYYHVYALDMFLAHYAIAREPVPEKVALMAEFLHALLGPEREIPFLGDDDGFLDPWNRQERSFDLRGLDRIAACGRLVEKKHFGLGR